MDKVKKMILFSIPMSVCNFRCSYCYLAQRDEHYQGRQPNMRYTPEQVAEALSVERIGGKAYLNFCADGETLLTKGIDRYIKALVELGHYAEIVTNLTITPVLDKILGWDKELLKRIEFKCSFHYLELKKRNLQLKKRNLLDVFAKNVNKIWKAGASANIEITPSDELIPYLEEVKEYSMKHFGALPHITIARDDRTERIDYLTKLPMEEYDAVWSQFDSGFWQYKKTIFGKKQNDFCYAGMWSVYVNLETGMGTQCYCGRSLGNIFENPEEPFPEKPIGHCPLAHCYNGHMLLKLGLIPPGGGYGDIRNRKKTDGTEWLQPELLEFFNSSCAESNAELTESEKKAFLLKATPYRIFKETRKFLGVCKRKLVWRGGRNY